jgi:ribosomal protein S18 acetylase RimI-like enzyme
MAKIRLATFDDAKDIAELAMELTEDHKSLDAAIDYVLDEMGHPAAKRHNRVYYVAHIDGVLAGYLELEDKYGDILEANIEFKQLGVKKMYRKKRIGSRLLREGTLDYYLNFLKPDRYIYKAIFVTSVDNYYAKIMYRRIFGAKKIAEIRDTPTDDVLMVAYAEDIEERLHLRNPDIHALPTIPSLLVRKQNI